MTDSKKDAAEAKAKATAAKAKAPKKPPFYVVEGKALTTKRGIVSDGAEIKADDLPGGREALDAFIESGHVAKG